MSGPDLVERLTTERDGWMRLVGEIAATVPLPYVIKATGTTGDLIAHFKAQAAELSTLRSRCETLESERDELLDKFDDRVSMHHAAEAARDEAVRALERVRPLISGDIGELLIEWPGQIAISISRDDTGYTIAHEGKWIPGEYSIFDEPIEAAKEIYAAVSALTQPSGKEKGDGEG